MRARRRLQSASGSQVARATCRPHARLSAVLSSSSRCGQRHGPACERLCLQISEWGLKRTYIGNIGDYRRRRFFVLFIIFINLSQASSLMSWAARPLIGSQCGLSPVDWWWRDAPWNITQALYLCAGVRTHAVVSIWFVCNI